MSNTHAGKEVVGQQYDPGNEVMIPYTEQMVNYKDVGPSDVGTQEAEITPNDAQSSRVRVFGTPNHSERIRYGQEYNARDGFTVAYSEQTINEPEGPPAALGAADTEIQPVPNKGLRIREYAKPTAQLAAYSKSFPGVVDFIDLPDTLLSVEVVYNKAGSNATHTEEGDGVSAGTSPSLTLGLNSKSSASASITPDLLFEIRRIEARNIPSMQYLFFMPDSYSKSELLTKLSGLAGAAVSSWPRFRPQSHTFVLTGQSLSISADADVQQHVSVSDSDATYTWGEGEGTSNNWETTTKQIQLPPTIHGVIVVGGSGFTDTQDITASAEASWDAETNWPARAASKSIDGTVTASVTPTALSATQQTSVIPTSGLYLRRVQTEKFDWGHLAVFAEVVNFADI